MGNEYLVYFAPTVSMLPADNSYRAMHVDEGGGAAAPQYSEAHKRVMAERLRSLLSEEPGGLVVSEGIDHYISKEDGRISVTDGFTVTPLPGMLSARHLHKHYKHYRRSYNRDKEEPLPDALLVEVQTEIADVGMRGFADKDQYQPAEYGFGVMHLQGAVAIGAMLALLESSSGHPDPLTFDRLFAYVLLSSGVVAMAVLLVPGRLLSGAVSSVAVARLPPMVTTR